MPYPPMVVQPMREELTRLGFRELTTSEEVDHAVAEASDPMLLVVNSICGCAAGVARPGVAISLKNPAAPKRLATVFAGPGRRSDRARAQLFRGLSPILSPDRHPLEGEAPLHAAAPRDRRAHSAEQVAAALTAAYEKLATPAA